MTPLCYVEKYNKYNSQNYLIMPFYFEKCVLTMFLRERCQNILLLQLHSANENLELEFPGVFTKLSLGVF